VRVVTALLQVGLVILPALLGFAAGGLLGAQFVPRDAGLAGGATVFLWAVGGMTAGAIGGAVAVRRQSLRAQRRTVMVCALLAVIVLAAFAFRIMSAAR
jgi:hypothetical protein